MPLLGVHVVFGFLTGLEIIDWARLAGWLARQIGTPGIFLGPPP